MVAPNDILGYYRMIEKIGAGGMGEVWKAEDMRLGRIVAIKILPPAVVADHEAIGRMRREARTAAQINHPNIATIYSFEEIGERLFIVEEYVEGEALTKLIARGGIAEADLCRIGRDVAEALAEAHAKGIIHRDIKPDNIIVTGRRVKVLDFGIAKQTATQAGSNDPTAFMTQQGMIIGTVHYMSPEQALGKAVDGRTDIFSLGIVLYQLATGRLPFRGETATETITQIVRDEPPDPASLNRSLSPQVAAIIARCLRKAKEERFESAADVASALDVQLAKVSTAPMTRGAEASAPTVLTGSKLKTVVEEPPKNRSRFWIGFATAGVAAAIAAFVVASRHREATPGPKPAPSAPVQTTTTAPPPAPATTSVSVTAAPPVIVPETVAPKPEPTPRKKIVEPEKPLTPPPPNADQLYAQGMTDLAESHPGKAKKQFEQAVETDPHYAKAHFRLGEIELMSRNINGARGEFQTAIKDLDRLAPRERKLAHLGLAITNKNWNRAQQIGDELYAQNPNDPDLNAFRRLIERAEQRQQQQQQRPFKGRRIPH